MKPMFEWGTDINEQLNMVKPKLKNKSGLIFMLGNNHNDTLWSIFKLFIFLYNCKRS